MNAGVTWRIGTQEQQDAKGILKDGPITAMYRMANELEAVRTENKELRDGMASLRGENQELREDMTTVKAENKELRDEMDAIKKQLLQLIAHRA